MEDEKGEDLMQMITLVEKGMVNEVLEEFGFGG